MSTSEPVRRVRSLREPVLRLGRYDF